MEEYPLHHVGPGWSAESAGGLEHLLLQHRGQFCSFQLQFPDDPVKTLSLSSHWLHKDVCEPVYQW